MVRSVFRDRDYRLRIDKHNRGIALKIGQVLERPLVPGEFA
jgi:hypothetical protein